AARRRGCRCASPPRRSASSALRGQSRCPTSQPWFAYSRLHHPCEGGDPRQSLGNSWGELPRCRLAMRLLARGRLAEGASSARHGHDARTPGLRLVEDGTGRKRRGPGPFAGLDLLAVGGLHARDLEAAVGAHHREAVGVHCNDLAELAADTLWILGG